MALHGVLCLHNFRKRSNHAGLRTYMKVYRYMKKVGLRQIPTCRKSPVEAGLFLVDMVVLCQDLVQVKMRNFSQIQPASSSALMCALLYTRSNSSGDIKSQ